MKCTLSTHELLAPARRDPRRRPTGPPAPAIRDRWNRLPGVAGSTTVPTGSVAAPRQTRRHDRAWACDATSTSMASAPSRCEQRDHPALARVEMLVARAGVDHDEMPVRRAQHRGVSLAHVHKMQRQAARARLRQPEVGHQCRSRHRPRRPAARRPEASARLPRAGRGPAEQQQEQEPGHRARRAPRSSRSDPAGRARPTRAMSSSRCSASTAAGGQRTADRVRTARAAGSRARPGTATAATGIATKLSAMPIGATAPSSHAVTGAVATVAPTDDAADCHSQCVPPASSAQRANRTAPQSDSTDSQPPRSNTANGIEQEHHEPRGRQQRVGLHRALSPAQPHQHPRHGRRRARPAPAIRGRPRTASPGMRRRPVTEPATYPAGEAAGRPTPR